ncbi:MAG: hypothetical protein KJP21_01210 [Bacteroidia bacterium]|nr:hypothetical protein [Bacteroidia bacterium]
MKHILAITLLSFVTLLSNAQLKMGNWAYSSAAPIVLNSNNIAVPVNYNDQNIITVKGMFNATPDAYVAIFSLSQEGDEEAVANKLINDKIEKIRAGLSEISSRLSLHVDIISFVPIYDQVLEKKVFSKNSFTEKPVGFELKKNIIIEYHNADELNQIFSLCTANEVYDYIRSDVVVSNMGQVKEKLRNKADSMIFKQIDRYARLKNVDMDNYSRTLSEGFAVVYPGEKYASYTAFSCTSYFTKKFNLNNDAKKKITRHYLPIIDKEFDFVVNPVIAEPAIQVMYQINIVLTKKPEPKPAPAPKQPEPEKEFFFITPTGDIKQLNI